MKTSKLMFMLLISVSLAFCFSACSQKNPNPIDVQGFQTAAEEAGFTVVEIPQGFHTVDYAERFYIALKDAEEVMALTVSLELTKDMPEYGFDPLFELENRDNQIQFFKFDSIKASRNFFEAYKLNLDQEAGIKSFLQTGNTAVASVNTGTTYYRLVQVQDTLLLLQCQQELQADFEAFAEKIGYDEKKLLSQSTLPK